MSPCHFLRPRSIAVFGCGRVFLVLALATSFVTPVWALDLKEAFELAVVNDSKFRASVANTDATREKLPQARAQLLPAISFSASRNQNNLTREKPTETQERYFSENQTLSLRQPLFRKSQWVAVEQARAEVDGAEAVLAYDKLDLLTRLTSAYVEALLADDQLAMVSSKKASMVAQMQAATMALEAGTGTRTEIDEARARLDMVLAEELEAQQHLKYTQEALELITGQKIDVMAALDPDQMRVAALDERTLDEWWTLAEASNPELQYWRRSVEVARLEVEKVRAGHYPTLDAVAQVVHSSAENVTSPGSNYRNRVLGLQLSVPLFSGGAVNSGVRQAHARLSSAEAALESVRRDLRLRLRKEYRGVTEGRLRILALEQAVRSAAQMVNSGRKSYAAGVRSLLDVFEAERLHQSALRDLSQARYAFLAAWVQLRGLCGDEPEKAVASVNTWLRKKLSPKDLAAGRLPAP